ncbi:hypothetical protein J3459_003998 [Metarhizium acridum]|nr:hypothetical protein J3459_003998 [Metarhizium acridum]
MGTIVNAGPNSYRINFVPPFPLGVIPSVFAAFSGIDSGDNWRGALEVVNANFSHCDIQVSTWGSSNLYQTNVQWIACPRNLTGVEMGTFHGAGGHSGGIRLRNTFFTAPSLFLGIQRFDIGPGQNARLRLRATSTPTWVNWSIDTWSNSLVYNVIGVYFAISS